MQSSVGGRFAALASKKKDKGATAQKPKAAKVMSLKDMADSKPKTQKKAAEPEKAAPAKQEVQTKDRELTKREVKSEQRASDRHVQRSGHAPSHGKKTDEVQDAVDAAEQQVDPKAEERRRWREEREAEEAERQRLIEEEKKKKTYAEYEKELKEKQKELGLKKLQARKVDTKGFAQMQTLSKDDDEALSFGKKTDAKKTDAKKTVAKTQDAKKKTKFVKSTDVQLGFSIKRDTPERRERPPRRDQPRAERAEEAPAAAEATPAADVAAPAAAEASE